MTRPPSLIAPSLLLAALAFAGQARAEAPEPATAPAEPDAPGTANKTPHAAPNEPAATPVAEETDIVLLGNDARLVRAVAAELRASGLGVIIVPDTPDAVPADNRAPIVRLERSGEFVVVTTALSVDGAESSEVPASAASGGLATGDATALRVAEAIRLRVTEPAPEPPVEEPPAEAAEAVAPVTATAVTTAPTADEVEPLARRRPIIRAAFFAGGGLNPEPAAALAIGLRGQVSPHFHITGLGMFAHNLEGVDRSKLAVVSTKAAILGSWELFGADSDWSPSVGGGVVGEYRWWRKGAPWRDGAPAEPEFEGSNFGLGYAVMAGIRSAAPRRFRFDIYADVRTQSWRHAGSGHDEPGVDHDLHGTVMATFGIDVDLFSRPAPTSSTRNVARR